MDRVRECLDQNIITIGWPAAKCLLRPPSRDYIRERVQSVYHKREPNFKKSGSAAGNLWLFLHDMQPGHLVLAPQYPNLFVAEVTSNARYCATADAEHMSYRRDVCWFRDKQSIPMDRVSSELRQRIRHARRTCSDITPFLSEVEALASLDIDASFPSA